MTQTNTYTETPQPETAQKFIDSLDLEYEVKFVPQSRSRNAGEDQPSLNWEITVGDGEHEIQTDYMQGIGHLPGNQQGRRTIEWAKAEREAAETTTGKSRINPTTGEATRHPRYPIPKPELVDVLYSLVMDADVLNYSCFEEWAGDMGFDPDSRKGEAIYRACLEIALTLRRIVDLDKAAEAFEDF